MSEWFPIRRYRACRTFVITLTCGHRLVVTAMPAMYYPASYSCHCSRWYQCAIAACEIK